MGVKESKPSTITYEDVIKFKRVDDSDLNRLREAFRRISPANSHISKQVFIKEVLGPGIPIPIAENIFAACGGTAKGIAFKDLVCGLILLTKGTISEKHKFLFDLYSSDGDYIYRDEFQKFVHASESGEVCSSIPNLFANSDKVSYEKFRDWIISYPELTSACRWLLTEVQKSMTQDFESPNFYQTLSGVTHLEEQDIIDLEKTYSVLKTKSKTGKLDLDTLRPLISPPVPSSVCNGLFNAFDENRDSHIDFKEIACGVSAACRGPLTERQKFCFKVFDADRDGILNEAEIRHMVHVLMFVKKEDLTQSQIEKEQFDEESIITDLMNKCGDSGLSSEEYLIWSVDNHSLASHFLNLIFQVCHIVLGLRPMSRQEEGEIITGWLEREVRRGFIVGQYWNLIHMKWWESWKAYVSNDKHQDIDELSHVETYPTLSKANSTSNFKSFTLGRRSQHSLVGNSLAMDHSDSVVTKRMRSLDKPSTHYTHNRTESYHSLNYEPFSPSQSPMLQRKKLAKLGPGPMDNNQLIVPSDSKITSLTGEGGKLKRNIELSKGREFELVPTAIWKVLQSWYGGGPALPRQVIQPPTTNKLQLEYHPVSLNLYRHWFQNNSSHSQNPTWGGIIGAGALINASTYPYVPNITPKRQLTNTATLSCLATVQQVCDFIATTFHINRQDVRLWHILNKEKDDNVLLLEDESLSLDDLGIDNENNNILIEVRSKDLTWPEELNKLATVASLKQAADTTSSIPGATGLNNLGNTCFMNAALQCVSNTAALTKYFKNNLHLYEFNRVNPLGMKGHIAKRYGELIHEIWSGRAKTIAPLKLRYTIGKYTPRFTGYLQQDSQEFLAFFLDGLHEDLNRVHDKPYVELKDSDGRPDDEVAREAWDNHIIRNKSIVVDLFQGQLKSKVTCLVCNHESVRFDPFNYLSLPLPYEDSVHVHVLVIKLDGTVPIKYGLKLNNDDKYINIKLQLSPLISLPIHLIRLIEIKDGQIRSVVSDDDKIRVINNTFTTDSLNNILYAYEFPSSPAGSNYSGDEERSSLGSIKSIQQLPQSQQQQRDAHNFTAIQRTVKPNVSNVCAKFTVGSGTNGTMSSQVNATGTNDSHVNSHSSSLLSNNSSDSNKIVSNNSHTNGTNKTDQPNSNATTNRANGSSTNGTHTNGVEEEMDEYYDSGNCSASNSSLADSTVSQLSNTQQANLCHNSSTGQVVSLIAYHRKMMKQTAYFLNSHKYKPVLFGLPIIVPCSDSTTHQDLYQSVWIQVARLVTPLPPLESITPNHAMDCDDSLGYEYPFVLKAITPDGSQCSLCSWTKFCLGCKLACDDTEFTYSTTTHLAIDWDPTALHLRYQSTQERLYEEHESVIKNKKEQIECINLNYCLELFIKEEKLGEKEKYYCSKCKLHQLAIKKLEIYKLPPVLIIHLKRFQFINDKWMKSQKVVEFPNTKFDLTNYLSSVPKTNILRYRTLSERCDNDEDHHLANENTTPQHEMSQSKCGSSLNLDKMSLEQNETVASSTSSHCTSANIEQTNKSNMQKPQDLHEHRLKPGSDPFQLNYNLYGIISHTGMMGGGHYVSYACNPNGKWYCYNDSSVRQVAQNEMETSNAYILFYERADLDIDAYLPDVSGKNVIEIKDDDDEFENDMKKVCSVM